MSGHQRWVFLTFSSISFFGAEVIVDQPSILVARLSGFADECFNGLDSSCKTFSASQFNGLYVGHFWTGGVTAIFTGFLIGRFGVWTISIVNAAVFFFGMLFFTVGPYVNSDDGAFALMVIGRMLFAIGYFMNIVLSHQVKAHWFSGKELALSFALFISSGRLGSVLTYATVGWILEQVGLQNTLWITFAVGLTAPVTSILAGRVYILNSSTTMDVAIHAHDKEIARYGFSKIRRLERDFWILTIMLFFYFGLMFTLLADFPKLLTEVYGYSETTAGILAGIIVDVGLIAPFIGWAVDAWGGRDLYILTATGCLLIVALILTLADVFYAILITTLAALSYAVMTGSIWCTIPVVTTDDTVGVAMGVATGIQGLAGGLWLLIAGFILDQMSATKEKRWLNLFILLTTAAIVSFGFTLLLIFFDRATGGQRRLRKKHVIPAVCAEMNEDISECASLVSRRSKLSATAYPVIL